MTLRTSSADLARRQHGPADAGGRRRRRAGEHRRAPAPRHGRVLVGRRPDRRAGAALGVDDRVVEARGALPSDAEARLLGFTELAETAIANTEARSELAASCARLVAAADEERRRVVSELHDGAQQRLELAIAALERAQSELRDDEAATCELVREALVQAERTKAELREFTHGILPGVLLQGGLRAAAQALASRMSIPVSLDVAAVRHPGRVEATAYFVIAETLTNVAEALGRRACDGRRRRRRRCPAGARPG